MLTACGGGGATTPTTPTVRAPALANITAPQSFPVGAEITAIVFTNTGGNPNTTASGCAGADLPAGLSVSRTSNGGSCQITGTPTTAAPAATVMVTATNSAGSDIATVSITITETSAPQVPALANIMESKSFPVDAEITAIVFTNAGGAPATCAESSTESNLPDGLEIGLSADNSSCQITGIPTTAAAEVEVTVTATNTTGSDEATVGITITPVAPVLADAEDQVYFVRQTGRIIEFANTGGAPTASSDCTASVNLPDGLEVGLSTDNSSCQITGTPTATGAKVPVTVTATNTAGRDDAMVNITVNATPTIAPDLTNAGRQPAYVVDQAITPLIFANTGGAPLSCSISETTTLPQGLFITITPDGTSCRLLGTPTEISAQATHTVLARNGINPNSEATVDITVNPAAPALANITAPQSFPAGAEITAIVFTNTGGAPATCTATDNLPAMLEVGLSADNSSCQITGTPTTAGVEATVTVTAANITGRDGATVKIIITPAVPVSAPALDNIMESKSFPVDAEITAIVFTNAGGAPATCAESSTESNLPDGLEIGLSADNSSCQITGIPTTAAAEVEVTVTATNTTGSDEATVGITITPVAPVLADAEDQVYFVRQTGRIIEFANTGGAPTASSDCTASVNLPDGLEVGLSTDNSSCQITGTPTATGAKVPVTVTATNTAGNDSATVNITVNAAPTIAPDLTNAGRQPAYVVDQAITPLIFANTGGAPLSCSISETTTLPQGLFITITPDGTSCRLVGTPTEISAQATYTVQAVNGINPNSEATVDITVNPAAPALANITAPQSFPAGAEITAIVFTNTGGAPTASTGCTATNFPAGLAVGLSTDNSSCQITGIPTAAGAEVTVTVTAANNGGSDDATVDITITPAVPAPVLADAEDQVYFVGQTDRIIEFANTGGAPTASSDCTASNLPAGLAVGLSADNSSCQITGTPTTAGAEVTVTVTATNNGGSDSATVNITVNAAPTTAPDLTNADPQTYVVDQAKEPLNFVNAGGAPLSCSIKPETTALPPGLSITITPDGTSCRLVGTPTAATGAEVTVTVTATNATGSDDATVDITIDPAATNPELADISAEVVATEYLSIAPITFVNTGTSAKEADGCGVSPDLPAGLSVAPFEQENGIRTCQITGAPTADATSTLHTVTATDDADETATATVTISATALPEDPTQCTAALMDDVAGYPVMAGGLSQRLFLNGGHSDTDNSPEFVFRHKGNNTYQVAAVFDATGAITAYNPTMSAFSINSDDGSTQLYVQTAAGDAAISSAVLPPSATANGVARSATSAGTNTAGLVADIPYVFTLVLGSADPAAGADAGTLKVEKCQPDLPTLTTDPISFDAVLNEALDNAVVLTNTNDADAALVAGSCTFVFDASPDAAPVGTMFNRLEVTTVGNTCEIAGTPDVSGVNIAFVRAASVQGNSNTLTLTFTVRQADTLSFANATVMKTFGDADFTVEPTATSGVRTFTYKSSNVDVATVNVNTGQVTIEGFGTTIITATTVASDDYMEAEASYMLTVNRAEGILMFPVGQVSATFGDPAPAPNLATRANLLNTGDIAYSSGDDDDDDDVATVDSSTGQLTIVGAGMATIRARINGTNPNFDNSMASATASYTLMVNRAENTGFAFPATTQTRILGALPFTFEAMGGAGDGAVTYISETPTVAAVDDNGQVTIGRASDTPITITATKAESANHNLARATYELTINAPSGSFEFTETAVTKTFGDPDFTAEPIGGLGDGAVTYESSDEEEDVASVDPTTGQVTIVSASDTPITITATKAPGTDDDGNMFPEATATYTIMVNRADNTGFAFPATTQTRILGALPFTFAATGGAGDGAVTYISETPTVATVDNDGLVTIVSASDMPITITATKAESANHNLARATYELTINAPSGSFEFTETAVTKTFGDPDFTAEPIGGLGDGAVTYESSDEEEDVASVDPTTGQVTIVSASDTPITITATKAPGTDDDGNMFPEATATYTIMVNRADNTGFAFPATTQTRILGALPFTFAATGGAGDGAVTYISETPTVATVDNDGLVTIVSASDMPITITATKAESANHNLARATYELTINAPSGSFEFTETAVTKTFGDPDFTAEPIGGLGDGAVTYESSDEEEDVASVDPTTGQVTIVSASDTPITITATKAPGTDDDGNMFPEATATYTIMVNRAVGMLMFATGQVSTTFGDSAPAPNLATRANPLNTGDIAYSSDPDAGDETVATVDLNTGQLTIMGAGMTTIRARINGTDVNFDNSTAEATYELTVEKATDTLMFASVTDGAVTAVFGTDSPPRHEATGGSGEGAITYTSETPTVAAVASDGQVIIHRAGTTTITATRAESDDYMEARVSYTLTVTQAVGMLMFEDNDEVSATFNGPAPPPKTATIIAPLPNEGVIEYSSDTGTVATVDSSTGQLTIMGAGMATIKATITDTDPNIDNSMAEATYTLMVNRATDTLVFAGVTDGAVTVPYSPDGMPDPQVATGNAGTGALTYEPGDTLVATVDNNGQVTVKGVGITTITATVAQSANYEEVSASYTLNVEFPPPGITVTKPRKLDLSWDEVTAPSTQYYKVLYSSTADGEDFEVVAGGDRSITTLAETLDVSVHRLNWGTGRYVIQSCRDSGTPANVDDDICGNSAPTTLALPDSLRALLFIKASNPDTNSTALGEDVLGDKFGFATSMTSDGLLLAVGAPGEDSNGTGYSATAMDANESRRDSGAVYIFNRLAVEDDTTTTAISEDDWALRAFIKPVVSSENSAFGSAVILEGPSTGTVTLAVGAPGAASGAGAVYAYTSDDAGAMWSGGVAVGTGEEPDDMFGSSLAIQDASGTEDFNLAIGAPGEDSQSIPIAATSTGADNTVPGSGAVYVYSRSSGMWAQTAYIKAPDAAEGDGFGSALSYHTTTLAVGAPERGRPVAGDPDITIGGAGGVYVYLADSGAGTPPWTLQQTLETPSNAAGQNFGYSVALNKSDSNTLAVGAPGSLAGAVFIFNRTTTTWNIYSYSYTEEGPEGADPDPVDTSGIIASNGRTYSTDRTNQATFLATVVDDGLGDRFGSSVSLNAAGTRMVVGAESENNTTQGILSTGADGTLDTQRMDELDHNSGALYVFDFVAADITTTPVTPATWTENTYIKTSNSEQGDAVGGNLFMGRDFGGTVAFSDDGNVIVVGVSREDSDGSGGGDSSMSNNNAYGSGAAYGFLLSQASMSDPESWRETHYLKATNPGGSSIAEPIMADVFGTSVALSGDGRTLAVGAPLEDSNSDDGQANNALIASGAVYLFTPDDDGAWTQADYLKASDVAAGDNFGATVALDHSGSTLVVGAPKKDGDLVIDRQTLTETGQAYVFTKDPATAVWSESAILKPTRNMVTGLVVVEGGEGTSAPEGFGFGNLMVINRNSSNPDLDGTTVAVGSRHRTGETDDDRGAVHIFAFDEGAWTEQWGAIGISNHRLAASLALNGAGDLLAAGIPGENSDHTATTVSQNVQSDDSGAVRIWSRQDDNSWLDSAYIKAGSRAEDVGFGDNFGEAVALDQAGDTLAVGAPGRNRSNAIADQDTGEVRIFSFDSVNDRWDLSAAIVAPDANSALGPNSQLGGTLAISGDGSVLAIGAPGDRHTGRGVNPTTEVRQLTLGSVSMFVLDDHDGMADTDPTWAQETFVKSRNPNSIDGFATAIALDNSGDTLAVGAPREDSSGMGIQDIDTEVDPPSGLFDRTRTNTGAVYLY